MNRLLMIGYATLLGALSAMAQANKATETDLAQQAQLGLFRVADVDQAASRRELLRERIARQAAATPSKQVELSLTFRTGLTAVQVERFAARRGIDVTRALAKVAVGTDGTVYTLDIGGVELEMLSGTLAQRLEKVVGKIRLEKFHQMKTMTGESREKARELIRADVKFYGLDGFALSKVAAATLRDPDVSAMLTREDVNQSVTSLRELRQSFANGRAKTMVAPTSRRLSALALLGSGADGSNSTNSVEYCEIGDEGPHCPPGGPEDPPPPEPITGDTELDSWIQANGGTSSTGVSSYGDGYGSYKLTLPDQPSSPPPNPLACGSDVPGENNCPNDSTYTPGPRGNTSFDSMGGVDAWGFAIRWVGVYGYEIYCGLRLVYGNGESWYEYFCEAAPVVYPVTYGATVTKIAWNKTQLLLNGHPFFRSTAAFVQSGLDHCIFVPGNNICLGSNRTYVPDAGFEDKMVIPNPGCSKSTRTDNSNDWQSGCFVVDRVVSDLQPYYRDTTYADPGNLFTASAGFTAPQNITVVRLYTTEIRFSAAGWQSIPATEFVRHRAAITTRLEANPACIANGFSDPWCYFNVDSRTLSLRPAISN